MKIVNKSQKIKTKKKSLLGRYWENRTIMFMMLPGLMLLIIFCYVPMYGLTIAFKDFKMAEGILNSPWCGLDVFKELFSGADFKNVLRNTIVISFLKLITGFPMPIIFALLLNEVRNTAYKRVIQTFSYLPYFFSWVVLGGIVTMVFSANGPVNQLLYAFGLKEPIIFFGNKIWFVVLLLISAIWQSMGWSSIIYLSALAGVDESLYEAAVVDGASRWKQTLHISLPCILPTVATVLILNMGGILNAGFDQIYNMYNPTVYDVADIIDTYVLRRLQSMDYSLGTAVGLFKSVVSFVMVITVNSIVRKMTDNQTGII